MTVGEKGEGDRKVDKKLTIRSFSYGGGVQSTAALVLAAQGKIDFPLFVFANVGDDSENPATLDYVRDHAHPFAAAHGIELVEVRRSWKDGRDWTLYHQLVQRETKSIGIPVRMKNGAPADRACTADYKVGTVARLLKERGATPENKAIVGLGISVDEVTRATTSSGQPHYDTVYPLIELRIDRSRCIGIIQRAGLPVPPKSSCWFCPWHSINAWRKMRDSEPELFAKSVELEAILNEKGGKGGPYYLTDKMLSLDRAVGDGVQPGLFDAEDDEGNPDACESGFCMT